MSGLTPLRVQPGVEETAMGTFLSTPTPALLSAPRWPLPTQAQWPKGTPLSPVRGWGFGGSVEIPETSPWLGTCFLGQLGEVGAREHPGCGLPHPPCILGEAVSLRLFKKELGSSWELMTNRLHVMLMVVLKPPRTVPGTSQEHNKRVLLSPCKCLK